MAVRFGEKEDSPKLVQSVRDGQVENRLTRKFIISGLDLVDPSSAVAYEPIFNIGYIANATRLTTALVSGNSYAALAVAALTFDIPAGSTLTIGTGISHQSVTTSADAFGGDTSIAVTSFTAGANFAIASCVALGASAGFNILGVYCIERQFAVLESHGVKVIEFTAVYGPPWRTADSNTGASPQPETEVSISTESVHLQTALTTQTHYPNSAPSTDVGNSINVTKDGIQGVDVQRPKMVVTVNLQLSSFSQSFQATLAALVATVNNANISGGALSGWQKGDLLFLGVVARQKGIGPWDCRFVFGVNPSSTTTYALDSGSTAVSKYGWDYVWLRESTKDNGSGTGIIIGIESAHVAKVYPDGDFSTIGI